MLGRQHGLLFIKETKKLCWSSTFSVASPRRLTQHRYRYRFRSRSSYSTDVSNREYFEQRTIPCKDGTITLNIQHPPSLYSRTLSLNSENKRKRASAIIHLSHFDQDGANQFDRRAQRLSHIATTTQLPTIQLSYRLNSKRHFPLPLHDILTGYDWIVQNILPAYTTAGSSALEDEDVNHLDGFDLFSNPPSPPQNPQSTIVLHATNPISSSLAIALALTECRTSQTPARISAVWAHNPILDWVEITLSQASDPNLSTLTSASSPNFDADVDLQTLKSKYFSTDRPSSIFDPFASPLLFFRTAGITPSDLSTRLVQSDEDNVDESTLSDGAADQPTKPQRHYARRHPPVSMGPTLLPSLLISHDPHTPPILKHQASELLRLLRKSFTRSSDKTMAKVSRKAIKAREEIDENIAKLITSESEATSTHPASKSKLKSSASKSASLSASKRARKSKLGDMKSEETHSGSDSESYSNDESDSISDSEKNKNNLEEWATKRFQCITVPLPADREANVLSNWITACLDEDILIQNARDTDADRDGGVEVFDEYDFFDIGEDQGVKARL